ncbi:MAG: CHASE domain-containing protein [Phenylobacterium sp.]|uniref:CHASE domain-containing protein n=1 Tax=Phenylobacterium sp. TaxID=1871053 RepID=UPI00391CA775
MRRWPFALPAAVAAVGLAATLAAGFLIGRAGEVRERLEFETRAEAASDALADRMDTYMAVLRAGAGLFAASEAVSLEEFRAFAERVEVQARYPGVQGVGFSIRIPPGGAAAITARMRAAGSEDFTIRPTPGAGHNHAIVYLEPMDDRNRAAIGFNMHSNSVRREAMDRARDTGLPALTGKVRLVQEIHPEKQAGFLVYEPVYEGGAVPGTVAERRTRLTGYVYAPFRAGDLLHAVLPPEEAEGLDYAIYDGEPQVENLLHASSSGPPRGALVSTRALEIAGRPWTIVYWTPHAWAGPGHYTAMGVVLAGLAITGLLAVATLYQGRARLAAEREVEARRVAAARQRLLLDELNHRVKNTLATVQSIAAQSLRHGADVNSVRKTFEARLIALSEAHNLLTRDNWRGASLADLARTELEPYGGGRRGAHVFERTGSLASAQHRRRARHGVPRTRHQCDQVRGAVERIGPRRPDVEP